MPYIHLIWWLHISFWLYIIFGGFLNVQHSRFIVYTAIPMTFFLHMLPFHIIETLKSNLAGNKHIEYKTFYERIPPTSLFKFLYDQFSSSFQNPFSPQGLLLIGCYVNLYILHKIYKEF